MQIWFNWQIRLVALTISRTLTTNRARTELFFTEKSKWAASYCRSMTPTGFISVPSYFRLFPLYRLAHTALTSTRLT